MLYRSQKRASKSLIAIIVSRYQARCIKVDFHGKARKELLEQDDRHVLSWARYGGIRDEESFDLKEGLTSETHKYLAKH